MKYSLFNTLTLLGFVVLTINLQGATVLPRINETMTELVEMGEFSGAVTLVASSDSILHLGVVGMRSLDPPLPMTENTIFRIASMTKPITGAAILVLQEDGLLDLDDPVSDYLPEFTKLQTPSGRTANITIRQLLNHTSGLGDIPREETYTYHSLADLVPFYVTLPMEFEPGAQWSYCQSGMNTAAHIVERVSGLPYNVFLQQRIFGPLGMQDTTHYLNASQRHRLAVSYVVSDDLTIRIPQVSPRLDLDPNRIPYGNSGLFSTARDYVCFAQMLLNRGTLDGQRVLSPEAVEEMTTISTGNISIRNENHTGWGVATAVIRKPEDATEVLSPGSFGHGGSWGTQCWIDPNRDVIYLLMIQRRDTRRGEITQLVRERFQQSAFDAVFVN